MLIKAREVKERLNNKVDPAVVQVLCTMAEQMQEMQRQLYIIASHTDQVIHIIGDITNVIDAHNSVVRKLDNQSPPNGVTVESYDETK